MTVAACFTILLFELNSHSFSHALLCAGCRQATKWIRSFLGTKKIVLLWDFTTVVEMWQAKTWRHPSGLNSDSGVFDLRLESQSIRETRSLTGHRVQFDYIIDEETEASGREVPHLWELGCGTQERTSQGEFAPTCRKDYSGMRPQGALLSTSYLLDIFRGASSELLTRMPGLRPKYPFHTKCYCIRSKRNLNFTQWPESPSLYTDIHLILNHNNKILEITYLHVEKLI